MLLAVDTSTPQIGLALYDGAQVLAESLWTSKARHTVELAPAVADMLSRAGFKMDQIEALGVAIGPGSFTSLRVGLSFIKGLALALTLPTIGVNTLDVVAASQSASGLPLVCILPAGRGRLAVGWYTQNQASSLWQSGDGPSIMTAQALSETITQAAVICGDLNAAERLILQKNQNIHLVSPALSTRRPAILAELAYTRWQAGSLDDVSSLAPLYLHLAEPIPDLPIGKVTTDSFGAGPK
jgi:tRNA threonylcarbamoyladenosine biosynthesis protein TsaB